jgi:spectinomycin phosphotransferase
MRSPPTNLEPDAIAAVLSARWGMRCPHLRYVPLGFGSHHWVADSDDGARWFVTVDDLSAGQPEISEEIAFEHLTAAFQTATALRDVVNLPFVIAPIADRTGAVSVRLAKGFSLAVFPFLNVTPVESGEFQGTADRDEAMRLIGQVHKATSAIPVDALRRDTLVVPNRAGLLDAFESLDETWNAGPYAEPARQLLRAHAGALRQRLHHFAELSTSVMAETSDWVISHGEPHAGNIVRTRSGNLVVADWDTVAYAPRERDLSMLVNEQHPDWSAYHAETGVTSLSEKAMRAYRQVWDLTEIAIYVAWCRKPHTRTEEMAIAWAELQGYVAASG